jgi:CubicO group peptidase (beta-lactamase class C family)
MRTPRSLAATSRRCAALRMCRESPASSFATAALSGSADSASRTWTRACRRRPIPLYDIASLTKTFTSSLLLQFEQPTPSLAALFDAPALERYESSVRRLALPYRTAANGFAPDGYPPRDIGASAGLLSNVVDLAQYDVAIDANVFIGRDSQERAWTNAVSTTGEVLPYGLGWFIKRVRGVRLIWHYG